jgi:hypothetical protein
MRRTFNRPAVLTLVFGDCHQIDGGKRVNRVFNPPRNTRSIPLQKVAEISCLFCVACWGESGFSRIDIDMH